MMSLVVLELLQVLVQLIVSHLLSALDDVLCVHNLEQISRGQLALLHLGDAVRHVRLQLRQMS